MNAKYFGLFLLVSALAAPAAVAAHHGAASFDTTMEVTLKGTVTEWQWFNPHCFLKFDVKGEDGTRQELGGGSGQSHRHDQARLVAEFVQARRPGERDAAAGENRGAGRPDPGRGARRRLVEFK